MFYHQTKTPISFWYRRRLNPRSPIQSLKILPDELTRSFMVNLIQIFEYVICMKLSLNKRYYLTNNCRFSKIYEKKKIQFN